MPEYKADYYDEPEDQEPSRSVEIDSVDDADAHKQAQEGMRDQEKVVVVTGPGLNGRINSRTMGRPEHEA